MSIRTITCALMLTAVPALPAAPAETPASVGEAGRRLLEAYPEKLDRVEGPDLVWKDGTRMRIDDGAGVKPFESWLRRPDIEDMLAQPYPAMADAGPPAENFDPGRARNADFFDKMYGDCRQGRVAPHLVTVPWLASRGGRPLKVTRVNGVAEKLAAVARELEALPRSFDTFLVPAAGAYVCRVIAGTDRVSAHGYGIAVDIATPRAHYWRWAKGGAAGRPVWRNAIPMEIVRIFEKHGFIWGGRWYHYDTMHFEYRPELAGRAEGKE